MSSSSSNCRNRASKCRKCRIGHQQSSLILSSFLLTPLIKPSTGDPVTDWVSLPSSRKVEVFVNVSVTSQFLCERVVNPLLNPQPGGPGWGLTISPCASVVSLWLKGHVHCLKSEAIKLLMVVRINLGTVSICKWKLMTCWYLSEKNRYSWTQVTSKYYLEIV